MPRTMHLVLLGFLCIELLSAEAQADVGEFIGGSLGSNLLIEEDHALQFGPRAAGAEKIIVSLNPRWLSTQLIDLWKKHKAQGIALGLCGGELHSCENAGSYLRTMTAQCSNVILGIIDVGRHPETPRDLYDNTDSRLILLKPQKDHEWLFPVTVNAVIDPDTVAIVMCPADSYAVGPLMRALGIEPM